MTLDFQRMRRISSIIIVPVGGCASYSEWFVETSQDGKEWELLARLPNALNQPFVEIDLSRKKRSARMIRINSGQGIFMPGINFRAVLVYGS